LTEDDIAFDHLNSRVNFLLEITVAHEPANTFHIGHEHIKPHDSLDNGAFRGSRLINGVSEVESDGPLVNCIAEVEIDDVEDELLLAAGVDVGL
jgi:hypothetical protein